MKNIAIAVLVLFAASLFGSAFVTGCMAAPRADAMDMPIAQSTTPSCCAVEAACMGASCFAGIHTSGCKADHGWTAVAKNAQAASDLAKAPVPAIIPALSLVAIVSNKVYRPKPSTRDPAGVGRYADIYARTGRLLI
jgi:hypothetical protein